MSSEGAGPASMAAGKTETTNEAAGGMAERGERCRGRLGGGCVDSPLMVEKEASSDSCSSSSSSCSSSSLVMMMTVEGGCRSGLSGDEGEGLDAATGSVIPFQCRSP